MSKTNTKTQRNTFKLKRNACKNLFFLCKKILFVFNKVLKTLYFYNIFHAVEISSNELNRIINEDPYVSFFVIKFCEKVTVKEKEKTVLRA